MKMLSLLYAGTVLCLGFALPAQAEQRLDHYKGEPAPTIEAAIANLSEYNKQLAAVLAKDELSVEDIAHVHQLTYTLENALQKFDAELDVLAEELEQVHQASERADGPNVKTQGSKYLERAGKIVR